MDRYHDSARPDAGPGDALLREVDRQRVWRTHSARDERTQQRNSRRRWIINAGAAPSTTPMWTSRRGWLAGLTAWTETTAGRAALERNKLRAPLLLRVAEVLAAHADHGTGRHCAATNATVARAARCSPRTVTTVRATLREADLAVEIRRGTGSAMTPHCRRRPSVWHLVSRQVPVDKTRVCHLPPSLCDWRLSHLGNTSPSVRARPPQMKSSPRQNGQRRNAPRPLALQMLAAQLVAGSVGLNTVHPGHICDALTRSGLALGTWTAPRILRSLNADMRATGWSWPDHIARPGAFLASRLQRLAQAPPASTETRTIPDKRPRTAETPPPASAKSRTAAMAYFRTHRRSTGPGETTPGGGVGAPVQKTHEAAVDGHCPPTPTVDQEHRDLQVTQ